MYKPSTGGVEQSSFHLRALVAWYVLPPVSRERTAELATCWMYPNHLEPQVHSYPTSELKVRSATLTNPFQQYLPMLRRLFQESGSSPLCFNVLIERFVTAGTQERCRLRETRSALLLNVRRLRGAMTVFPSQLIEPIWRGRITANLILTLDPHPPRNGNCAGRRQALWSSLPDSWSL
jgi:hypothetical protein